MNLSELDLDGAVQQVLKNAAKCRGIFRGLHECSKAIEQRKAVCCFLAENCDDKAYCCLIEALCREHEIPLIKIADNKKLGELAGLCKYDKEGKARKVVSASCIVVRDIGEESYGWKYLVEKYHIPVQARES
ncbi:hypothetical protein AHF37_07639 [Paragonimus kellicotti]|nr:hypothetical protein AHF37_07639 [Paragonimus kellicotti]